MREYTDTFYESLNSMIDKKDRELGGYRKCLSCGAVDGAPRKVLRGKNSGDKRKSKAIVRLALINPQGSPSDPKNIGYYCTTCRRGKSETSRIPKEIRDSWPRLF